MRRRLICLSLLWSVVGFFCSTRLALSTADENTGKEKPADEGVERQEEKFAALNTGMMQDFRKELGSLPSFDEKPPDDVDVCSRRGDLHLFLGDFAKAESDYLRMVVLNPDLDHSHWRLGIAMYLAGHPEQAAAQFDKYHSFDNVDRENGIWRYLSHRAAFGKKKASEQLLKYEKDDRPPFREVYRLFEGSMTTEQLLASIPADLPTPQRNSRLFYAHLYIGLFAAAEGHKELALMSLRDATLNPWPREAGFGPNYMWHVGRLEYLKRKAASPPQPER